MEDEASGTRALAWGTSRVLTPVWIRTDLSRLGLFIYPHTLDTLKYLKYSLSPLPLLPLAEVTCTVG